MEMTNNMEDFKKALSMGYYHAWLESVPKKCIAGNGTLVGPTDKYWHTTDFTSEEELDDAISIYHNNNNNGDKNNDQ